MTERVFRCKRSKPGDGGVVDGCGWQGYESSLTVSPVKFVGSAAARYCPQCGSDRVREMKLGSETLPAPVDMISIDIPPSLDLPPWHGCLITFVVNNVERAQDVNLHPDLPKRWMLICSERMGTSRFHKLEFEVEGVVNVQDGEAVKRIIEELGMV